MKLTSTLFVLGMVQAVLAQSIAPSPTESIGCEPHGDHWHCEGPRPTEDTTPPAEESVVDEAPAEESSVEESPAEVTPVEEPDAEESHADHDHEDSDDDSSVDPGPSPTESINCEPHGDHWHCEGPAETADVSGEDSEPTETDPVVEDSAAGAIHMNLGAVVAVAAFAML